MSQADWTWIIYLAGDNNLEGEGRVDLGEMKEVGSSERLNIIVQFDTEKKGTSRYRVEKRKLATLQTMPGVNTGDPKVLADFIKWTIGKYPASHYLVDIWNHGGGWENLPADYDYAGLRTNRPLRAAKVKQLKRAIFRTTTEKLLKRPKQPVAGRAAINTRAVAIDTGSHDYLDNRELRHAMTHGFGPGRKADILGLDACLMNMLEIAYEMRTNASFMVGSEQTEPGAGWPYADILKKLRTKPDMAPVDLATTIATEYGRWYHAKGDSNDGSATQSTLDLTKIEGVVRVVDELAIALTAELPGVGPSVAFALSGTQKFEDYPEYVDLRSFATQLQKKLPADSKARPAVASLLAALAQPSAFVIANATWGRAVDRASGVSIYFPKPDGYSPDYKDLDMSKTRKWQTFLEAYNKSVA